MSQKNKIKLVLLVHEGGTQTNLKTIRNAIDEGKLNAEISAVVSDKEDAMPMIERITTIMTASTRIEPFLFFIFSSFLKLLISLDQSRGIYLFDGW